MVDTDRLPGLQASRRRVDDTVRALDDVVCRAVVLHQELDPRIVVLAKALDECDVGVAKGVDVLVVVPDRHERELHIAIGERSAGERRHQPILQLVDILIFVDEHVTVAAQQPLAQLVGLVTEMAPPFEQAHRLL